MVLRALYDLKMLSPTTLEFLDVLCRASHEAYPEGGTLWTYVEAANQGHSRFRDSRRTPAADALSIAELARWLQWAQGDRAPTSSASIDMANKLVALLREDLGLVDLLWSFEDGGSDMSANIYMARSIDNRFFALELWWSED